MKPYIITIASQKGGSGKTTTATNLAHGLILDGFKTLLVDADRQGSARDWNEANEAEIVPVIGLDRDTLPKDLEAIKSNYDIIVIDTPPRTSKLSAITIRIANLVIIPVQPSPYDVMAIGETVELIKQRHEIIGSENPKAYFLISQEIKNTNVSKEIETPLLEYGFPILKARTSCRVWYKESAAHGQSVFKDLNSVAAEEFLKVVKEIVEVSSLKEFLNS